ncbi:MAG TPA: carbohydrate kinase, partial [Chitinophagaceae bacterium]
DEQYKLLQEETTQLKETTDEDGFPCEDVEALTKWIEQKFLEILFRDDIDVKAVNFSGYGASFVYVDSKGKVIAPLYNYLKPYPDKLKQKFYNTYGRENKISRETASPALGSLNSGMQLYRLKYEKPHLLDKVAFAFHLPQYLSYILADLPVSEITSIGCHTGLWNFRKNKYHSWVTKEKIDRLFPPIIPSSVAIPTNFQGRELEIGIGLHDSSAALIPYLSFFHEPFILISTGTWNISLNPFNRTELTDEELRQDCLCYLSYEGKPVKASRLFAGHQHEQELKKLAAHFNKKADTYKDVEYNDSWISTEQADDHVSFSKMDLNTFQNFDEAYHHLMVDIVEQQVRSTSLILKGTAVKKIFVDGGFARNSVFINMLAKAYPHIQVYAATIAEASALGAALAIHKHWNNNLVPANMIELKCYSNSKMNFSI